MLSAFEKEVHDLHCRTNSKPILVNARLCLSYYKLFCYKLFRFESKKTKHGFKFEAFRKRLDSGNETRVARMSAAKLSKRELYEHTK